MEVRAVIGTPRVPIADDPRPAAPLPVWLGHLFEPAYRFAISRRNRGFDRGRGVTRLDVPVISVGNLSVGGTGKTPMVAHIVSTLLREGLAGGDAGPSIRPCIAMRGYTPSRVRAKRERLHEPDETDAYRRMFPDVPIVAQPDRLVGLRRLFATSDPRPTCVVLDDGFQHRKIARDLDIVLIDASRSPLDDRLLPAGWMREPLESLKRADLIVLTHAELVEPADIETLDAGLRSATGQGIDAVARHVWTGLRTGEGEREQLLPLDWLLGKRIAAACAIGNPAGFLHSLRVTMNADDVTTGPQGHLIGAMTLPDHDPYGPEVVSALARLAAEGDADAIVVTDKDWSKLRRLPADRFGDIPVLRPVLAMVFERGQAALDAGVVATARGRRQSVGSA